MSVETGQINVQTENIFPIIKKFLYSDQEIFLRELISNAVDATQKLRKYANRGEVKGDIGNTKVEVLLDEEAKTITIRDNGIGMTGDEVKKYINQIAFSSAQEFLDKFKDEKDAANIIGHFGLGFYSAFMVADKVELITKSYQEEATPVKWTSEGDPTFTLEEVEKEVRGTDVVLHVSEEAAEYLQKSRISELLNKYCKFLPVEIKFGTTERKEKQGEGDDAEEITLIEDNIINNPNPAWTKTPSDLTDEDYLAFYQELYPFSAPPLFWIHLNVDYPFNLTGILYFPTLGNNFEVQKNKIHLYSNQVFVTDQVENIVPEFLVNLHGVIDSPDIPLNVSRSYLQSDPNVKKINSYITKKVADKLAELFKNDRPGYEEKWESIGLFVKYGMMSDEKFYDRAKDFCLYKNVDGKLFTSEEYLEKVKALQTDKNETVVFLYANDAEGQDTYIQPALNKGYDVLLFDTVIDNHFINHIETKLEKTSFKRVDADTLDKLIEKDETIESVLSKEEEEKVTTLFKENINDERITVQLKALSPEDQPSYITQPEWSRRMKDMAALSGGSNPFGTMPDQYNLVINTNHELVGKLLRAKKAEKKENLVNYMFDLAMLSQGLLKGNKLTEFINRSVHLIG